MTWSLALRGLSGPASAANIHLGKAGKDGAVAIGLCAPCRPGAHGAIFVTRKVFVAVGNDAAYVEVHTAKNPGGEVRGRLRLTAVL